MDENNKTMSEKIFDGITFSRIVSILLITLVGFCVYIFRGELRTEFPKLVTTNAMYFFATLIIIGFFALLFKFVVSNLSPELKKKILENINFTKVYNSFLIVFSVILVLIVLYFLLSKSDLVSVVKQTEHTIIRLLITLGLVATTTIIGIKLVFTSLSTTNASEEFKNFFQMAREVFTAFIAIVGTIMGFYYGNASSDAYKDKAEIAREAAKPKEGWIYLGTTKDGKTWVSAETISKDIEISKLTKDSSIIITNEVNMRKETENCNRIKGEYISSIPSGEKVTLLSDFSICPLSNANSSNINSNVAVNSNATSNAIANTNTNSTSTEKASPIWVKVMRSN